MSRWDYALIGSLINSMKNSPSENLKAFYFGSLKNRSVGSATGDCPEPAEPFHILRY